MFKRTLSLLLCLLVAAPALAFFAFAQGNEAAPAEVSYEITDPYAEVDWDRWGIYKAQLHTHSNASDGYLPIREVVEKHYDLNYDILAVTDHGTINRGWDKKPQLVPLLRLVKYERTKLAPIYPLTAAEYEAYTAGTAASATRTRKNGMLDIPQGIELNMATPKCDCHLTGYFADYGQGLAGVYGDYETPSKGVNRKGGISMLSHVGEYVYPDKDSAEHIGQKIDEYYVNKFARIFLDNKGSSVGMGINSATDEHTRCDRILYDQILQKTILNGVVPWGFAFADSHNVRSLNDAYTMMVLPELTNESFRKGMENGWCFAVSHYSNGVELNGMEEIPGFDGEKLMETEAYLRDDTPLVTRVTVDDENDTISIEGENFNSITWVSNCNVIRRETGISDGKATLDLRADDLLDTPYLYVRFYITGDNGICYSQPFVISRDGEDFGKVRVPKTHDISTLLRTTVTMLDWTCFRFNPIIWAFKLFFLGYNVFDRFFDPY